MKHEGSRFPQQSHPWSHLLFRYETSAIHTWPSVRAAPAMRGVIALVVLLCGCAPALSDESCAADEEARTASVALSSFAHTANEDFVAKVVAGARQFHAPTLLPVRIDADSILRTVAPEAGERFFTYVSINGWNNQLLNLLCAIDMARLLNRTLIIPPFQWPKRRGPARVSVCRLIDVASLAAIRGVRIVCEDEHASVEGALTASGLKVEDIAGEGQPHRKAGMPRWTREQWERDGKSGARSLAGILRVTCCIFWTWSLPEHVAIELYTAFQYHPNLVRAARDAAAPVLGGAYGAAHVRRGDKVRVDKAYTRIWEKMTPDFFLSLLREEQLAPSAGQLFVATDELDRAWFEPLRAAGYSLVFVDDLEQRPLLRALSAYPQQLWADVLAILEQIICTEAPNGFVGSLPSTLSGHVINMRRVHGGGSDERRPLFTKLHELCCDERTAIDLMRLPGVTTLADVPCVPGEGNAWC